MRNITECCRHSCILFFVLFLKSIPLDAQLRWDGGGGNGQWMTAANWVGNILPSSTTDVILDNSFVSGNYTVTLPAGNIAVTVKSLAISPGPSNKIEVILPATNTAIPAFTTSGPAYGLTINNGGVFRDASGATSGGAPVEIFDSLRINNGGRFIHSTVRSHAALVAVLSKIAGTEQGIFEFDIPGTAGYTPSASGRTYGTMVLSATASGGARSYTSTGSQNLTIRGDFIIGSGVNYSLSFTGSIIIKGNYIQNGGMFNLASQADNPLIAIAGNLTQNSGTITETQNGLPVIELNGIAGQNILVSGNIVNSVTLRIKNTAGIVLQSPVSLPYKLELIAGKINTSLTNLLTLKTGCMIQYDSLSNNSFVNGPMRKEGLSAGYFLFPVGKDNMMRWLSLRNATGNFIVEYVKSNPHLVSQQCAAGIHHTSSMEYWTIEADSTSAPSANVELSFSDPNSGGITDLSDLRVAQFSGTAWNDAGNTNVTGTPGSRGSVVSTMISEFEPAAKYFTLGSASGTNSLPLRTQFPGIRSGNDGLTRGLQLMSVSPSIVQSGFIMTVQANQPQFLQVLITNAEAKVIRMMAVSVHAGVNTVSVNVMGLSKGFYYVSLTGKGRTINTLRFVKL